MRGKRLQRGRRNLSHGEVQERWLITYSDLITLLLVFFIIMFSMSQINQAKYQELEKVLAIQFHSQTQMSLLDAESPKTPTPKSQSVIDQTRLNNLYRQVKSFIVAHHLQNQLSVTSNIRGVQVTFRDIALFSTGSANLRLSAFPILKGLAPFFQEVPNSILVEGYTDNRPIHTALFPSNWQLSASRAISVVQYLQGQNISPGRMSAVGYGQYHPVQPNNTAIGREKNRRVSIVVLRNSDDFILK